MYFRLKPWQPKKESVRSAGSPSSLTTIFLESLSMDRAMYGIVRQGKIVKIEHRVLLSTKTFCLICYFHHKHSRLWSSVSQVRSGSGICWERRRCYGACTSLTLYCTLYIIHCYCILYIVYFVFYDILYVVAHLTKCVENQDSQIARLFTLHSQNITIYLAVTVYMKYDIFFIYSAPCD